MNTMYQMNMDEIIALADEIRADNPGMSKIEALEVAQDLYPRFIEFAIEWNDLVSAERMEIALGGDCAQYGVMSEMFPGEVS